MENSKFVRVLLIIAGLIGMGVGGGQLFIPVAFEASAGIPLGDNIGLLSEIRAAGGTLFVAGIFILLGAFISGITFTSIVLSGLFYCSYGLSRLMSMMIDGIPTDSLVIATLAEIVIGVMSLFVLYKLRKQQHATS